MSRISETAARLDISPEYLASARLRYAILRYLRGDASAAQVGIVAEAVRARGGDETLYSDVRALFTAVAR